MNLVYLSTLATFAVRKEHEYRYFEVIELRPRCSDHHWKTICGYSAFADAIQAAEAMERWEIFGERAVIYSQGVPKEDLPPHKSPSAAHHNVIP